MISFVKGEGDSRELAGDAPRLEGAPKALFKRGGKPVGAWLAGRFSAERIFEALGEITAAEDVRKLRGEWAAGAFVSAKFADIFDVHRYGQEIFPVPRIFINFQRVQRLNSVGTGTARKIFQFIVFS